MKVSFITSDFKRGVSKAPDLILKNRFFEQNPSVSDDGAALIARPGLNYLMTVGDGPIRGMFSEPGAFNGDLFIASGDSLYRVTNQQNATFLCDGLYQPDTGAVNMTITQAIGTVPDYLFIADGRNLRLYKAPTATAGGTLTASGTIANNTQVVIDTVYYKFTSGSVDTGTPTGTSASPWLVALGANTAAALESLYKAINQTGTAGTDYSTGLTKNASVVANSYSATTVVVAAATAGAQGNSIATTETGANLAWTGATLSGGAGGDVTIITTPDDVGVFDVITIASYVVLLPVQEGEYIGRFYWIAPGETTIDSLNFATAETYPDRIVGVKRFGDQFWLPGEKSTEVWYPSGDANSPMERLQGVVFDRGAWEGAVVAVKETLISIDADGGVFAIRGGQPQRISTPAIEEEIRKAIQTAENFEI